MDQRGDRRSVGKGEHRGIVPSQQTFVHHTGEDMREHFCETGEEVLCRQSSRTFIPELFKRQYLACLDDSFIMDSEIHHLHCHLNQLIQRIRYRLQVLRGAKVFRIIGDHLIQQSIPDGFLALIVLIDPRLHKSERCAQFADVCPCIAVL